MLDQKIEEVGLFFLIAVIIVSLASFTVGVNEYVKSAGGVRLAAQVFLSPDGGKEINTPLVELFVSPAVVAPGDTITLTWKVSRDTTSCVAGSVHGDLVWTGARAHNRGPHSENLGAPQKSTEYSIECAEEDGITTVASTALTVQ